MKKVAIMSILVVFILSGCDLNRTVETEEIKEFYKVIKENHTFIENSIMYKRGGPDTLVVEYSSGIDATEEEVAKCFEATRKWLVEEENLKGIQDYLEEDIKQLDIRFHLPSKKEIYTAHYYTPGPYDQQDSQYGNENNVDGFTKWQHEMIEKEDK